MRLIISIGIVVAALLVALALGVGYLAGSMWYTPEPDVETTVHDNDHAEVYAFVRGWTGMRDGQGKAYGSIFAGPERAIRNLIQRAERGAERYSSRIYRDSLPPLREKLRWIEDAKRAMSTGDYDRTMHILTEVKSTYDYFNELMPRRPAAGGTSAVKTYTWDQGVMKREVR